MKSQPPEHPSAKHVEMFRQVAAERLNRLNLLWVKLEQGLAPDGALTELLREVHTIKGEASLMGYPQMTVVAHAIEDLLRPNAQGAPTDVATGDLVLRGLDLLSAAIADSKDAEVAEVNAYVNAVQRTSSPAAAAVPTIAPESPPRPPERVVAVRTGDSVHVTAGKLDRMRDIIGELMLTHARLMLSANEFRKARQTTQEYKDELSGSTDPALRIFRMLLDGISGIEARLRADSHRISELVGELDATTRDLRMVPIQTLFEQIPIAVRELARELGRTVSIQFDGEAVEVDRSVLSRLSDPLLHLIRNAIDHGIEPPEVRLRSGKRAEGTVRVAAKLRGRMLELAVSDDGAGIDVEVVRARAVELGLVDAAQARDLTAEQVLRTLFFARMSTRREVTAISGRGLGLNIVLANVESLGGTVTVQSSAERGTTFDLAVPLSLAMTAVVLFEIGGGRYALPATTVVALVDASAFPVVASIDGPSVRYGGALIPLLPLDVLLGEPLAPGSHPATEESARLMIVTRGRELVALSGTHGHSQREVVLQSTGKFFKRTRLISAVIPLPDGSLALVLALGELLNRSARAGAQPGLRPAPQHRAKTVLVVDDSPVVRDLVAEALRAHGLRVLEANDGQDALDRMEQARDIDLVVTDVDMPKLDGIGLLKKIRQHNGPRRLPVVIVSMRGSSEDQRRALDAGADAYLVKTDLSHAGLWTMLARFLG